MRIFGEVHILRFVRKFSRTFWVSHNVFGDRNASKHKQHRLDAVVISTPDPKPKASCYPKLSLGSAALSASIAAVLPPVSSEHIALRNTAAAAAAAAVVATGVLATVGVPIVTGQTYLGHLRG